MKNKIERVLESKRAEIRQDNGQGKTRGFNFNFCGLDEFSQDLIGIYDQSQLKKHDELTNFFLKEVQDRADRKKKMNSYKVNPDSSNYE